MIHVAAMLVALVVHDDAAMRAAPSKGAPRQAVLHAGDWLEVRGREAGYIKVYDHRHERPGYIREWLVREYELGAASAPTLRTLALYHRDMPGAESLGIGFAALYLRAVERGSMTGDVLVALGTMADRLATRASGQGAQPADRHLPHHVDVAKSYGVVFANRDSSSGGVEVCYDGGAFGQALAVAKAPEVVAASVLGATRQRCYRDVSVALEIARTESHLELLGKVDVAGLAPVVANQVRLRVAELSAKMAFYRMRRGQPKLAREESMRALDHLARTDESALDASGRKLYERAAIAVGAAKWARMPAIPAAKEVAIEKSESGESCVVLRGPKPVDSFRRCSHGVVWQSSVRVSGDGRAIVVAVQPLPTWVELWVFRRTAAGWSADALVPAVTEPESGYVEWAGFSRNGKKLLVVREALLGSRTSRRFQAIALATLSVEIQASSLSRFTTFKRHRAREWTRSTVALR